MPFSTGCRRLAGFIFCSLLVVTASFSSLAQTTPPPTDPRDTLRILAEEEQRRTMDPALGRVPYERLEEARKQLLSRKATGGSQTQGAIPNVTWQERGPSNAGGRTRALLFDPSDPTHKKVWAGSPVGGLWYTNDITDANADWTPVSDAWENTIVTALASDPSNPQIMYAGTGDYYNNRPGGGIWKTTDGGANWVRLNKTIPGGNAPAVSRAFDYIQRVVVNSSGQVFVGTQYGVVRSVDGGTTWSYALAPIRRLALEAPRQTTTTTIKSPISKLVPTEFYMQPFFPAGFFGRTMPMARPGLKSHHQALQANAPNSLWHPQQVAMVRYFTGFRGLIIMSITIRILNGSRKA